MKIRYYLLASASTIALGGGASAADLAVKGPGFAPRAPASWAGWYVGINGGVITTQTHLDDRNNWTDESYIGEVNQLKSTGGIVGGQIGFNWQEDAFVYGLEGDFDGIFGSKNTITNLTCPSCGAPGGGFGNGTIQSHSEWNWLRTIRGRAGITVGATQGTLLYVTGGLALAGVKSNWGAGYTGGAGRTAASNLNPNSFTSDGVKVGWTAGLGIEHMFASAPHWSLRAEALWVQLANDNVTNPGPSTFNGHIGPFHSQFQNEAVLGRVGLNYKF